MILCINSSPRREATEHILTQTKGLLEEKGFEPRIIALRDRKINFCKHCDYCLDHKECVQDDDMRKINEELSESEALVLATPVYNSGISGQLKTMMDRTRAFLANDPEALKGKIGMGIVVGGDRMGGQELALMQIHSFYILNGVLPVSGGSFGANLGATFWSKDSKQGVEEDEEGFKSLKKTINRFSEFIEEYR